MSDIGKTRGAGKDVARAMDRLYVYKREMLCGINNYINDELEKMHKELGIFPNSFNVRIHTALDSYDKPVTAVVQTSCTFDL